MSSLAALARSAAPQLLQLRQYAAEPALSLGAWYAWRCHSTAAANPDPFQQKLQQKTEQEILELLEKGRAAPGGGEEQQSRDDEAAPAPQGQESESGEIGGPKGPEPTRFGDWEIKGRASDF